MAKHIPMRMCIGCRQMFPKPELYRIVSNEHSELCIDSKFKIIARGVYVCGNIECINKARKKKVLERQFKNCTSAEDVYKLMLEKAGEYNG